MVLYEMNLHVQSIDFLTVKGTAEKQTCELWDLLLLMSHSLTSVRVGIVMGRRAQVIILLVRTLIYQL